jgi:hypothetical protein
MEDDANVQKWLELIQNRSMFQAVSTTESYLGPDHLIDYWMFCLDLQKRLRHLTLHALHVSVLLSLLFGIYFCVFLSRALSKGRRSDQVLAIGMGITFGCLLSSSLFLSIEHWTSAPRYPTP